MALRRSNHRPLIQPNLNRLAESPLPRNGAGAFCFPRYTPPSLLAVSENANTFPEDERTSPVGRRRGGATGLMSLVLGGFISGFGQKKNPQPASWAVDNVVDKVIHRLWISLWKSLACLWIPVQHLSTGDTCPLWIKPNSREFSPRTRNLREPRSTNRTRRCSRCPRRFRSQS